MASSLISDDCPSVAEANALFSTEKGLLVLRPRRGCCGTNPWFTIPSGCYALVTRHGADLNFVDENGQESAVWPAGLHYPYPPWVGVSNLVTKQSIVLDLPVKACKTMDNVTVNIDISLVFRIMGDKDLGEDPELVRNFVYAVKPRGLEQQLRDAQEEAVRGLARSMKHTEIYGIRSGGKEDRGDYKEEEGNEDDEVFFEAEDDEGAGLLDVFVGTSDEQDRQLAKIATEKGESVAAEMRARLNGQFISQGVEIQSVMIKSVELPPDITSQMTEKTMVISANAHQRMVHENEMQNTRMDQEIQTMLQGFHEERQQEVSAGAEIINAQQVQLNDSKAQAIKSEKNIREETRVHLENIKAESALEVQRVRDRTVEAVVKIEADAQKLCAELLADTQLETQTLLSESELTATKNTADAELVLARAEGTIATWLQKKKEHMTREKRIHVYEKLAQNDDLIISGSSDDETNLVAVADAILERDGEGLDPSSRSEVLAELALLKKGSDTFLAPVQEQDSAVVAPSSPSWSWRGR